MSLPRIEISSLSRYRAELMGAAMIFIILFHVFVRRSDPFFGLHRLGNIGVDMFLFVSGIGLWFAWTKNQSLTRFYKRRLLRIYPAWIIVACLFYIPDYLNGGGHSTSVPDLLLDITTNWGFWQHDELTFWYIPAILALYLVAPAYMELVRRHPIFRWLPVLMIVWCFAVQWVTPIHQAVGHIEIFWSRVPIFFIGINVGEMVRQKQSFEGDGWWLLLLIFCATFSLCLYLEQIKHGRFPLFIERLIYIPLTISSLLLLAKLFQHLPQWVNWFLRLVGTLSLEIYLLHVHFVMKAIAPWHLGYWGTALCVLLLTLPLAWLLHQLVLLIEKKIFCV